MAAYVVVLDANILYGIEVTDFFATMATRRLFRPHWSPKILDEVERNLAERPDLDPAAIERRLTQLNRALPAALDRRAGVAHRGDASQREGPTRPRARGHVGAPTIVTDITRHFPAELLEPFDVEAVTAVLFAFAQVDLHLDGVRASIAAMAARRRHYPKTPEEIIGALSRYLPEAMACLRDPG